MVCAVVVVVDVVGSHHVVLTYPVIMKVLAWNWPETGTHPRGKEFIEFGRIYWYFLCFGLIVHISEHHGHGPIYISEMCVDQLPCSRLV